MAQQNDFEREVLNGLAELRGDMKAVRDHLKRLNGSVEKHEVRIQEQDKQISAYAVKEGARKDENDRWEKRIHPIVMLAVGLAIGLLLMHGPDVIKALK